MNKKATKRKTALLLLLPLLFSCSKIDGALPKGEYETGTFLDYFYKGHDDFASKRGNRIETTISSDSYWNGTDSLDGSETYTAYLYSIKEKEGTTSSGLKADLSSFNSLAHEGKLYYWKGFEPEISFFKDENVPPFGDMTFSFETTDASLFNVSFSISSAKLSILKAGEADITFISRATINGVQKVYRSQTLVLSVEAPFGERTGISDPDKGKPELFEPEVSGKKLSLSPLYDWLPTDAYKTDEEFFASKPSFGRYYALSRVDEGFQKGISASSSMGKSIATATTRKPSSRSIKKVFPPSFLAP